MVLAGRTPAETPPASPWSEVQVQFLAEGMSYCLVKTFMEEKINETIVAKQDLVARGPARAETGSCAVPPPAWLSSAPLGMSFH